MGLLGNRKKGRRGTAPLLISVFWLISTLGATLGAGYIVDRDANIASTDIGSLQKNAIRIAHDVDSSSAPTQRPLRIVALEAFHLKIKSGLRTDAPSQDGFLPSESQFIVIYSFATETEPFGSDLISHYNSSFSARAPPLTA